MVAKAGYHADTNYLNDNWAPRAWDFEFGSLLWSSNAPPIFRGDDIRCDMTFDADERPFEPFRKGKPKPVNAELDALTSEDEHAI
jgi:hypothetical protein